MSEEFVLRDGDVYCPSCFRTDLDYHMTVDRAYFDCARCGPIQQPFEFDEQNLFQWVWNDKFPATRPGCPWCGTRYYQISGVDSAFWTEWYFRCFRGVCGKTWRGTWTRKNNDWKTDRWKIKVPVATVPWRSGTIADLECARRLQNDSSFCCRYPKSCSAYDPGYTTGVGPTELPIVWNDGYGWRSGAPDITAIPDHLIEQTVARWTLACAGRRKVPSFEEVTDDDGDCGPDCQYYG